MYDTISAKRGNDNYDPLLHEQLVFVPYLLVFKALEGTACGLLHQLG